MCAFYAIGIRVSTSEFAGVEGVEDAPYGRDFRSVDRLKSALQEDGGLTAYRRPAQRLPSGLPNEARLCQSFPSLA